MKSGLVPLMTKPLDSIVLPSGVTILVKPLEITARKITLPAIVSSTWLQVNSLECRKRAVNR